MTSRHYEQLPAQPRLRNNYPQSAARKQIRGERLAKRPSRSILAGYVFGSGIIIVISQLESLFGLDIDTNQYTTDLGAAVRNWATPMG